MGRGKMSKSKTNEAAMSRMLAKASRKTDEPVVVTSSVECPTSDAIKQLIDMKWKEYEPEDLVPSFNIIHFIQSIQDAQIEILNNDSLPSQPHANSICFEFMDGSLAAYEEIKSMYETVVLQRYSTCKSEEAKDVYRLIQQGPITWIVLHPASYSWIFGFNNKSSVEDVVARIKKCLDVCITKEAPHLFA